MHALLVMEDPGTLKKYIWEKDGLSSPIRTPVEAWDNYGDDYPVLGIIRPSDALLYYVSEQFFPV